MLIMLHVQPTMIMCVKDTDCSKTYILILDYTVRFVSWLIVYIVPIHNGATHVRRQSRNKDNTNMTDGHTTTTHKRYTENAKARNKLRTWDVAGNHSGEKEGPTCPGNFA